METLRSFGSFLLHHWYFAIILFGMSFTGIALVIWRLLLNLNGTTNMNEFLPIFQQMGAELLGISVDSAWCHLAFVDDRKLRFQLLADFEPKGEVAKRYGVYRAGDGTSERALFVLDADGIIRWSYVSPAEINPGADGILTALESLQSSEQQSTQPQEAVR